MMADPEGLRHQRLEGKIEAGAGHWDKVEVWTETTGSAGLLIPPIAELLAAIFTGEIALSREKNKLKRQYDV